MTVMTAPLPVAAPPERGARLAASAPSSLDALRRRGVRLLALVGWAATGLLIVAEYLRGAEAGAALLIGACMVNIGPTAMALQGRSDVGARMTMGVAAAVLPAMLVFVFRGHPWQMDAHMYFFVGLAALVILGDWRPIVLAGALTAAHHTMLEWLAPNWVFLGSGNFNRLIFHILAVGLQCVLLSFLTIRFEQLFTSQDAVIKESQELARIAEHERGRTQDVLESLRAAEARTEIERGRREQESRRTDTARRAEFIALAAEFERSVSGVVNAIGGATERLERSAIQLDDIAGDAGKEAGEVAIGASQAATELATVASSIGSLSQSILMIAVAAGQQSALTETASSEANRSVETIAALERQAVQIEGFLQVIRDIASKTNLLALNATIEAARAGDAGRGFAIVASEVKTLAADTTRASDKISVLLTGIHGGVADTGIELRSVNSGIGQVALAAAGIADAVRAQRLAAQQIDSAADRTVSTADTIKHRIDRVAGAVGAAAALSLEVRGSATDLAASARNLRTSTDLFVSFLRSDITIAS